LPKPTFARSSIGAMWGQMDSFELPTIRGR
jgi:hypothetical protein